MIFHLHKDGLRRAPSPGKGQGLFTTEPLERGTFVLEYVGEVMPLDAFKERVETTYLGRTHYHCINLDGGLVVDGGLMGGEARFINHSCDPNCHIEKVLLPLPQVHSNSHF